MKIYIYIPANTIDKDTLNQATAEKIDIQREAMNKLLFLIQNMTARVVMRMFEVNRKFSIRSVLKEGCDIGMLMSENLNKYFSSAITKEYIRLVHYQ